MRTSVNVDNALLVKAMKISGIKTKTAVLDLTLREYLRKNTMKQLLKYRGKNIWEGDIMEMRSAK